MKTGVLITTLMLVLLASCSTSRWATSSPHPPVSPITTIAQAIPPGWIISQSSTTNSHGVVWTDIVGPTPHSMEWSDKDGNLSVSAIGFEALSIGVSTNGDCQKHNLDTWFFGLNVPVVYSRGATWVYGYESFHISDDAAFKRILDRATWTRGCNEQLSWPQWRQELRKALVDAENSD